MLPFNNLSTTSDHVIIAQKYLFYDLLINVNFLDRVVPVAASLCSTQSTWCTTSPEEKDKCEIIRAGGITTGVYPLIECRDPTTSVVSCLSDISAKRADFAGIDSNFGYIARQ